VCARPNVRDGSSTERLNLSISRLLFPQKADAGGSAERTVDQGCRSHAARNAALASPRLMTTPPFGPCDGAHDCQAGVRLDF
jgi:hypothetical protein